MSISTSPMWSVQRMYAWFYKKNSKLYEICDYHSKSENENYCTLETIGSLKNHEKTIYQ